MLRCGQAEARIRSARGSYCHDLAGTHSSEFGETVEMDTMTIGALFVASVDHILGPDGIANFLHQMAE